MKLDKLIPLISPKVVSQPVALSAILSAVMPIVKALDWSPVAMALSIVGVLPDTPLIYTTVPFGIVLPVEFLTLLGKTVSKPRATSTFPPASPKTAVPMFGDQFICPSKVAVAPLFRFQLIFDK